MNKTQPNSQRLTERARLIVKTWLADRGFGFLLHPDKNEKRDIFIHKNEILGKLSASNEDKLSAGDVIDCSFMELPDGRLRVIKIHWPEIEAQADSSPQI